MARNKHPEETVKKILAVSEKLFLEKGYDNTTVQDIIDQLGGLTKGVIYHHFDSKEAIFNQVLKNKYEVNDMNSLENMTDLSGFEKIKKINSLALQSLEHQKIVFSAKSLIKNPKLIGDRYNEAFNETIPYLKKIIDEGIADGSIETEYPQEIAELLVLSMNFWLGPTLYELDEKQLIKKITFFQQLYEGINFPMIDEAFINDVRNLLKAIKK
ncbi:TetR/AcrR family transcriptional regulator [Enterococcus sp. LJL99]